MPLDSTVMPPESTVLRRRTYRRDVVDGVRRPLGPRSPARERSLAEIARRAVESLGGVTVVKPDPLVPGALLTNRPAYLFSFSRAIRLGSYAVLLVAAVVFAALWFGSRQEAAREARGARLTVVAMERAALQKRIAGLDTQIALQEERASRYLQYASDIRGHPDWNKRDDSAAQAEVTAAYADLDHLAAERARLLAMMRELGREAMTLQAP